MAGRPLVGWQRRIADEIRPLDAEAGERQVEVRVCVTATGTPDCSVTRDAIVQSLASAPSTPCSCRARPAPAGRSHTTDDTKTCGMSPVE